MTGRAIVLRGDAASLPLPDGVVDLIVTSPPYFGLRSYTDTCRVCLDIKSSGLDPAEILIGYDEHVRLSHHYDGQIGSEATPAAYLAALLACTREWMRVLKPEGSLFVNLGDKYSQRVATRSSSHQDGLFPNRPELRKDWKRDRAAGLARMPYENVIDGDGSYVAEKCLMGLPWRYALACTDQLALILRAEIIWDKPNGLPESVTDRVRRSHEQVFHFTRQPRYYTAVDEIREAHIYPAAGISWEKRKAAGEPMRQGEQRGINPGGLYSGSPLGKLPGSVWSIPSAPLTVPPHLGIDHFAAYPPELVRRIILGWSPPGICTACGQGRRPVWERSSGSAPDEVRRLYDRKAAFHQTYKGLGGQAHQDWLNAHPKERVGYACACPRPDAPARPACVVDPFGGTGTTALVAAAYGRTGITIDRSADYCRLAQWRVHDPAERARAMHVPKPPPVPDGQGSLFDDWEAAL